MFTGVRWRNRPPLLARAVQEPVCAFVESNRAGKCTSKTDGSFLDG